MKVRSHAFSPSAARGIAVPCIAAGGLVTFNCGGPATSDNGTGTGTEMINADTTVDGGGLVTVGVTIQAVNNSLSDCGVG